MLVVVRCLVSTWPEWHMLRVETEKTLADFIFQDLLCWWGAISEIVMDNGATFVSAIWDLQKQFKIHHISISPYNSKANGIVEHSHFNMRQVGFQHASSGRKVFALRSGRNELPSKSEWVVRRTLRSQAAIRFYPYTSWK